jgi:hypothetical protein
MIRNLGFKLVGANCLVRLPNGKEMEISIDRKYQAITIHSQSQLHVYYEESANAVGITTEKVERERGRSAV